LQWWPLLRAGWLWATMVEQSDGSLLVACDVDGWCLLGALVGGRINRPMNTLRWVSRTRCLAMEMIGMKLRRLWAARNVAIGDGRG
jgi:hypothetical protein